MGARYILALVLMIAVMIIWSQIYPRYFAPEMPEPGTSEETPQTDTPEDVETEKNSNDPTIPPIPTQDTPDDPKVHVKTSTYNITFNEKWAEAKRWELVEKKENGTLRFPDRSNSDKDIPLNLIPETAVNCLGLSGIVNFNEQNNLKYQNWKADKKNIELSDTQETETLIFTTVIDQQLKVSKKFVFYNNSYTVDLYLTFENVSETPDPVRIGGSNALNGYELQWGPGINADLNEYEKMTGKRGRRGTEGAITYIGTGKPKRELKQEIATASVLWAGISSQYFSAIMIPEPDLRPTYLLVKDESNSDKEDVVTAPTETAVLRIPQFSLAPQQQQEHAFRLYVGPKDDTILKQITPPNAEDTEIKLPKIIDFGFFAPVAWAMLWVVKGLYTVFQNYGIAIILLTFLVKVISFPLTRKAHVSMKKMQQLQPQLTELREKYRDDPQKFNKASMRIYKENGVNPLSGCIPWIPQLPIFWALFALLGSAVEFRGAPFLLWINDLSAPDTLYKLPFSIPIILPAFGTIDAIRFLPILNGVTTMLQQKFVGGMSPTPASTGMQAKLMKFMPLIFVFIFYNWASGFVLYWLCNNIFTVGQQYIQTRFFHDGEPDIKENTPKRQTK
ncbi:membrane protein insertase YidC [Candidatus Poribacteria bacterium]|nr:membrane protein insertase YidC [Candidatus Poribacteria bacterium]MYB66464.1 membrane protein insertase YidC [Candidatus Poribacteria bacterium]MYF56356.1 membrane protein insertase YidC [Candidatus Poribacteria bacterium]MYI94562.1 membrane protein insertase YidC [Candidatus Poribacteria bacterium]